VWQLSYIQGIEHSILPALSLDGIIALDILKSSVNKDRFLLFLWEQVVCVLSVVHIDSD
jgi:hypothetical protein